MAIITISRGSYSKGKEIAEKLAERLGYQVHSRDVLLEASSDFNTPEIKLVRALHDAPSVLDRFTYGKERYVSYIKKEMLEAVAGGDTIYHGLAGHFLLKDVPNVMKVRVIADIEDRVKEEMKRENIDEKTARHVLKKDDDERRKWGLALYGIDTNDPSLYDMVLHIGALQVDDAVELLYDAARLDCFAETDTVKKALKDQLASARLQAALIEKYPTCGVTCQDGECVVVVNAPLRQEDKITAAVEEAAKSIDGVDKVKTVVNPVLAQD